MFIDSHGPAVDIVADEFFQKFDESKIQLLYDPEEHSRFFEFVEG